MRKGLVLTVSALALLSPGAFAQTDTPETPEQPAVVQDPATDPAAAPVANEDTSPAPDATADDNLEAAEEPMVEDADTATAAADDEAVQTMPATHASADELIGENLVSADGENIGAISDLIFSQDSKMIEMVVVDVGGFLGIGAKPVALDFAGLQAQQDETGAERYMVGMSAEELEALPEFQYEEPAAVDPAAADPAVTGPTVPVAPDATTTE